jgi:RNA polymerase sigma-70 factor (ECF subfamily)
MNLEKLIKSCVKQKRKAQQELYVLFAPKLFAVCLKYSRNKEEAEDNLQDSFLLVFEKIGQYKHKGSFEGWLKRICMNTCLQRYRKHRLFELVSEEIEDSDRIEVDEEQLSLQFLLSIIQALPNRYRLVFSMYVLDGFSHKEIANQLDISEGTSKSNLARARAILKQKIEEEQQVNSNAVSN